jgi:hypothetical protein
MKITTQLFMALSLLVVPACNKHDSAAEEDSSQNDVAEVAPPSPPPSDLPAPSAAPDSAPPPTAPQFAPAGVFYLVASVSVETTDGIIGLKPGTQVIKQDDGSFDASGRKLQLRPEQITNDLQLVRRITEAERAAQPAVRSTTAAPRPVNPAPGLRPATPAPRTTASVTPVPPQPLGSRMDTSVTRVKGGYIWKRNSKGEWEIDKPVRN